MNDILDELYRRFFYPSHRADLQREIEDAHQQLIERLGKPEGKLVLRILAGMAAHDKSALYHRILQKQKAN